MKLNNRLDELLHSMLDNVTDVGRIDEGQSKTIRNIAEAKQFLIQAEMGGSLQGLLGQCGNDLKNLQVFDK